MPSFNSFNLYTPRLTRAALPRYIVTVPYNNGGGDLKLLLSNAYLGRLLLADFGDMTLKYASIDQLNQNVVLSGSIITANYVLVMKQLAVAASNSIVESVAAQGFRNEVPTHGFSIWFSERF